MGPRLAQPPARRRRRAAAAIAAALTVAGLAACSSGSTGSSSGSTAAAVPRNPLAGVTFYRNHNDAELAQISLRGQGRTGVAQALQPMASQPTAIWLNGSPLDATTIAADQREASWHHQVPVFVMYNIMGRDCSNGFSGGGAANIGAYRTWFHGDAAAIKGRGVYILEPDLVPNIVNGCLKNDPAAAATDLAALTDEVKTLKYNHPGVLVYIDAGNSGWVSNPADLVPALDQAGIQFADGVSLNVANFFATGDEVRYGQQLSHLLGGKGVIIDTSRNGHPLVTRHICNPPGLALGHRPTTNTGYTDINAFVWVKTPGDSDGNCGNGAPPAGQWWLEDALGLVRGNSP